MGDRAEKLEAGPLLLDGNVSGSDQPWTVTLRASTSVAWPLPGEAFTSPSTLTLHPTVSRLISDS